MSAAALFLPGAGDFHVPVTVRLADIPRGHQRAAWRVFSAIIDFLRRDRTELGERYTDRILQQSPWLKGYGRRFIQKGLKILQDLGLIQRIRQHGRRRIVITGRLRGRARLPKPQPKPKATKPASIPNVGTVPTTTPEQLAAVQAAIAAAQAQPQPMTAQEQAEAQTVLDQIRARRQAAPQNPTAARKVRLKLARGVDPDDPKLAEVRAELEARQQARRQANEDPRAP
jgi:hypothetical protein